MRARRARVCRRPRRHRRDVEPDDRARGPAQGTVVLDAAHPRARGGRPDLDRDGPDLGRHRGDGRPRRGAARAGLPARGRPHGPAVDPDEPGQLSATRERCSRRALRFAALAPEHPGQVPGHARPGIRAIEAATAAGVRINATVCFTVPQAIAVAEAVERGLDAFAAAGWRPGRDHPGLHDHGRPARRLDARHRRARRHRRPARTRSTGPGIAAFKRAYGHLPGARLPDAAARGGVSPPTALDRARRRRRRPDHARTPGRSASTPAASCRRPRIDVPVDPASSTSSSERIPDFGRAYEPDGLAVDEFDGYGATVRTLRGFIARTTSSSARSATSCCPTRTCARADVRGPGRVRRARRGRPCTR